MAREEGQRGLGQKIEPAYYPIPAFWPFAEVEPKVVKLMADLVSRLQRYGPASRIYEIIGDRADPTKGSPVQQVLLRPTAIFEGIREHQAGGMCYCGIPTCAFTNSGAKIPPIPNKVYCVYLNAGGKYFESGWEPADPDEPGLPREYQIRYGVKLWPKPKH